MLSIVFALATGFEWFAGTKIGRIVGLIGLVLGAIAFVYYRGKRIGRNEEREANKEETEKLIKEKEKIDEDIANDSDADLDKRVRPWIRKRGRSLVSY